MHRQFNRHGESRLRSDRAGSFHVLGTGAVCGAGPIHTDSAPIASSFGSLTRLPAKTVKRHAHGILTIHKQEQPLTAPPSTVCGSRPIKFPRH